MEGINLSHPRETWIRQCPEEGYNHVGESKEIPVTPMLAHKWSERGKHITAPFYVQPKIDGVRLLVSNKGGISRTGKVIKGTETWGKDLKDGEYLDGECYHPDLSFEQITSLFRMQPDALEFRVFDYFDTNRPDLTFEENSRESQLKRFSYRIKRNFQNFIQNSWNRDMKEL